MLENKVTPITPEVSKSLEEMKLPTSTSVPTEVISERGKELRGMSHEDQIKALVKNPEDYQNLPSYEITRPGLQASLLFEDPKFIDQISQTKSGFLINSLKDNNPEILKKLENHEALTKEEKLEVIKGYEKYLKENNFRDSLESTFKDDPYMKELVKTLNKDSGK